MFINRLFLVIFVGLLAAASCRAEESAGFQSNSHKSSEDENGQTENIDRPVLGRGSPLESTFRGFQDQVPGNDQWLVKTLGDILKLNSSSGGGGGGIGKGIDLKKLPPLRDTFEKFIERLAPKSKIFSGSDLAVLKTAPESPTTTSTTTPRPTNPMRQLARGLESIGTVLTGSSARLIEAPLKAFNGILKNGANLTSQAADGLIATSKAASKVGNVIPGALRAGGHRADEREGGKTASDEASSDEDEGRRGGGRRKRPRQDEDESKYYEFDAPYEPYAVRRPKYFSRECPFRFACEVGKLLKPATYPYSLVLEKNRFIQDLHNRYTRAMTYGAVRGNCSRYYCVLVKMLGGPVGFAGGVAEIVNRALNSELYSDHHSDHRKNLATKLAIGSLGPVGEALIRRIDDEDE